MLLKNIHPVIIYFNSLLRPVEALKYDEILLNRIIFMRLKYFYGI